MRRRVVITGLGVVAPNGVGVNAFTNALRNGVSGITHFEELDRLNFSCQIGGMPTLTEEHKAAYFSPLQRRGYKSTGILYGGIAGMEAWEDADLPRYEDVNFNVGVIFGAGILGSEVYRTAIHKVDEGQARRLGSTVVPQIMTSGISALLAGNIGAGNVVTTNSSACSTGTEAILMAYDRISAGKAECILAGSTSEGGPYVWGGFDAMRVMSYKHNHEPTKASRPMSASASGFVPGCGAGALVLESLERAQQRGATIYAEVAGGHINSGGQRNGGTMTAPNAVAIRKCISEALINSHVTGEEIDYINGHLTATIKDPNEIESWSAVLGRDRNSFPFINSLKAMNGHCLAASGSIESVSAILQMNQNFVFAALNSEDLHPEIEQLVSRERIPLKTQAAELKIVAKASFGFGDVNSCIIFKQFAE